MTVSSWPTVVERVSYGPNVILMQFVTSWSFLLMSGSGGSRVSRWTPAAAMMVSPRTGECRVGCLRVIDDVVLDFFFALARAQAGPAAL